LDFLEVAPGQALVADHQIMYAFGVGVHTVRTGTTAQKDALKV